jgi:predicted N-acetyltransferase YhbS
VDAVIRTARPQDGAAVRRLVFGVLTELGIPSDPDGADADVMAFGASAVPAVTHLVAECGAEPVGCAILIPHDARRVCLSKLVVRPDLRGAGLGRRLCETAVRTARGNGYAEIFSILPPMSREAAALLESLGWLRDADRHHLPLLQPLGAR